MSSQAIEKKYTLEEYFALEEQSGTKFEYLDGKIEAMSGGTDLHNQIAARVIAALVNAIDREDKDFIVYSSDMKIQIPTFNHFVYPDAVVVCEKPLFYEQRRDIILNPLLVVEILSPKTESYDRGLKFYKYRTLPSFKEYLMLSQESPLANSFYREEPDLWRETEATGREAEILLRSVGCSLSLEMIYKNVRFES